MGSCSSSQSTVTPSRPNKHLYFVRYPGSVYGTETYKLYLQGLTYDQIQHYIIRMLNIYKCQYEYIENDTIVIHNIYTITFNNMFANLTLSQIVDIPVPIVNQSVNIIPSAPIAEDPN